MSFNLASIILALMIGIFGGVGIVMVLNVIKGNQAEAKAKELLNDAKKEADKHKRDSLLELKEESFRLKQEAEKEIK